MASVVAARFAIRLLVAKIALGLVPSQQLKTAVNEFVACPIGVNSLGFPSSESGRRLDRSQWSDNAMTAP
jgi:hypothetical protein